MTTDATTSRNRGFWSDTGKTGIAAWLFSTDHKRIGLLYFYSVLGFFMVGVILGLLIRLELIAPGRMTPQQYDQFVHDVVNFLDYVGDPQRAMRRAMGVWVVLFLLGFTWLAWLLKREFWKDVK